MTRTILAALALLLLVLPAGLAAGNRERARKMLTGPGIEVDPSFAYYIGRSARSIASEVKVNGYTHVHYVVTKDAAIRKDLIAAFHAEGLPVWYATFASVSYDTTDLPPGWQAWKMTLRASPGNDFVRLCMTDPAYRKWKSARVASVMKRFDFDGLEILEPFWPETGGPLRDVYGCLNDACLSAFAARNPGVDVALDFSNPDSPNHYTKKSEVYAAWVDFRVRSIGEYLRELFAASRFAAPEKPVLAWSLAQLGPDSVSNVRVHQGNDAPVAASLCDPDAWCLQSNWMDWMRGDLPADYLKGYSPFVEGLLKTHPGLPVAFQLDIGSAREARQDRAWITTADATARSMGATGTISYEYFIGGAMYKEPPRLVQVRPRASGVTLVYQKRVDAGRVAQTSNYIVRDSAGGRLKVTGARADGNMVLLGVAGLRPYGRYTVTVGEVRDTPDLWLFKGQPAHSVKGLSRAFTWQPASGGYPS